MNGHQARREAVWAKIEQSRLDRASMRAAGDVRRARVAVSDAAVVGGYAATLAGNDLAAALVRADRAARARTAAPR